MFKNLILTLLLATSIVACSDSGSGGGTPKPPTDIKMSIETVQIARGEAIVKVTPVAAAQRAMRSGISISEVPETESKLLVGGSVEDIDYYVAAEEPVVCDTTLPEIKMNDPKPIQDGWAVIQMSYPISQNQNTCDFEWSDFEWYTVAPDGTTNLTEFSSVGDFVRPSSVNNNSDFTVVTAAVGPTDTRIHRRYYADTSSGVNIEFVPLTPNTQMSLLPVGKWSFDGYQYVSLFPGVPGSEDPNMGTMHFYYPETEETKIINVAALYGELGDLYFYNDQLRFSLQNIEYFVTDDGRLGNGKQQNEIFYSYHSGADGKLVIDKCKLVDLNSDTGETFADGNTVGTINYNTYCLDDDRTLFTQYNLSTGDTATLSIEPEVQAAVSVRSSARSAVPLNEGLVSYELSDGEVYLDLGDGMYVGDFSTGTITKLEDEVISVSPLY